MAVIPQYLICTILTNIILVYFYMCAFSYNAFVSNLLRNEKEIKLFSLFMFFFCQIKSKCFNSICIYRTGGAIVRVWKLAKGQISRSKKTMNGKLSGSADQRRGRCPRCKKTMKGQMCQMSTIQVSNAQ